MQVQIDVNLEAETISFTFGWDEVQYSFYTFSRLSKLDRHKLPKTTEFWRELLVFSVYEWTHAFAELNKIESTNFEITYNII